MDPFEFVLGTSLVDAVYWYHGFEKARCIRVPGEGMRPQGTVGETRSEYLTGIHTVIVHGQFDYCPGEIDLPLSADSVIFIDISTPITKRFILASVIELLA